MKLEVTDEAVAAFAEAWEAKRIENGSGIHPAGTKTRAGLAAAFATYESAPVPVVPPTNELREEIMRLLNDEGAYCGDCDFESGYIGKDKCGECARCLGNYADALLPLIVTETQKAKAEQQEADALKTEDVRRQLTESITHSPLSAEELHDAHEAENMLTLIAAVIRSGEATQ